MPYGRGRQPVRVDRRRAQVHTGGRESEPSHISSTGNEGFPVLLTRLAYINDLAAKATRVVSHNLAHTGHAAARADSGNDQPCATGASLGAWAAVNE